MGCARVRGGKGAGSLGVVGSVREEGDEGLFELQRPDVQGPGRETRGQAVGRKDIGATFCYARWLTKEQE